MKICQSCGHQNTDEMNYCLSCGKPLPAQEAWVGADLPTVAVNDSPTVREPSFETRSFQRNFVAPPTKSGGRKVLIVLGGLAVLGALLLFLGAAGFIAYRYFSPSTPRPLVPNTNMAANGNTNANGAVPSPSATPTPNTSFTPPTEPTKNGTFTVYANGGWQLSDIYTVPLENFRTKVDGKVDLMGVKTGITSKGVTDAASKSRRIYPEYPTGALLMRTRYADGKFSNVMAVSAAGSTNQWRNYPDERGRIEFCINDNAAENNGGQFTVTVTMTSVPKAKK